MNIKYLLTMMVSLLDSIVLALPAASALGFLEEISPLTKSTAEPRQPEEGYLLVCNSGKTGPECFATCGTFCSYQGIILKRGPLPHEWSSPLVTRDCAPPRCWCSFSTTPFPDDPKHDAATALVQLPHKPIVFGTKGGRTLPSDTRQIEQEVDLVGAQPLNSQANHPEASINKRQEADSDTHTYSHRLVDASQPTISSPIFPRIIPTHPPALLTTLKKKARTHTASRDPMIHPIG